MPRIKQHRGKNHHTKEAEIVLQTNTSSLRMNQQRLVMISVLSLHTLTFLYTNIFFERSEMGKCDRFWEAKYVFFLSCTCQTTGNGRIRSSHSIWCLIIPLILVSAQSMNPSPGLDCTFILCYLTPELFHSTRKINF